MELFYNPAFGVFLTIGLYALGLSLCQRFSKTMVMKILNPMLIALLLGLLLLSLTDIPLEGYQKGADLLNFFLGPIVVTLAWPLYKNRSVIKEYLLPIFISITIASFVSMVSVILIAPLLGITPQVMRALIAKSTTSPIALEVTKTLGGSPSLGILAVIFTGNLGVIIAGPLFHLLRIHHPHAKALALGTSSHAIGTATAFSLGKTEGALSGLAMGLAGILTVLLLPFIKLLFPL